MAQVYKMMLGTSERQWEQLTVREDGRMTMTFHGRDREISHEVTENEDGWLCYPGAMYPGLQSGKWQKMDDGRCKMDDVRCKPAVGLQSIPEQSFPTRSLSAISHQLSKSNNGWLRSVGYLAAASAALVVAWESGLIIPLGLIGLATSGILK